MSGSIIHLNGNSSAGKSTIAKILQTILDEPFYLTGIDHFLRSLPSKLIVIHNDPNPPPAETWLAVFEGDHLKQVEVGPKGLELLTGMYSAIASLARSGINVIIDDVLYDEQVFKAAVTTLPAEKVFFVGITCPVEVAIQREAARGDRAPGGAKFFGGLVHLQKRYDLEVDSATSTPEEAAHQIQQGFANYKMPTAFQFLRQQMENKL